MNTYKRLILKVGTKVLSKEDGNLDVELLRDLVAQIAELRKEGIQIILVTSGAVGAGKSLISVDTIESETVRKQVLAAVGQVKLMNIYSEAFGLYGYHCAQVLVTKEDFRDKEHYLNMQNCFEGLLLDNVIPIVNENDVVATTELLFTDNDELAGLIASQLKSDALVILTGTNGILDDKGESISVIDSSNIESISQYINPDTSTGGRGGMTSKLTVAKKLFEEGIEVHIVNGKTKAVLLETVGGKGMGTRFTPARDALS